MVYDPKRGCVRGEEELLDFEERWGKEPLTFDQVREAGYRRAITAFKHAEGLVDWSPADLLDD